jgi:hypothetical protein
MNCATLAGRELAGIYHSREITNGRSQTGPSAVARSIRTPDRAAWLDRAKARSSATAIIPPSVAAIGPMTVEESHRERFDSIDFIGLVAVRTGSVAGRTGPPSLYGESVNA